MKKKSFLIILLLTVVLVISLNETTVSGAVKEGNILDGHASVPKGDDVASSKYAVIAQFKKGKSERIITGVTTKKSNKGRDLIVEPKDNLKGKIKVLYTDVGSYKGRKLDFEIVVTDWEKAGFLGGEFMYFYDTHIGFSEGGYNHVSLDGTYKYADTGKPATDLTGSYMTINDLDANQFVSFTSDMVKKIDKIYAYDNSWVSYWKKGAKTNIGARFYEAIDSDDEVGIITMLVSGYQFNFDWSKDWTRPSSNNQHYNFNRVLDWKNEASAQYFGYISEKPVRTEVLDPTKKIISESGEQVDSNEVTVTDTFIYEVYHTVPSEYEKFYYNSYEMEDSVDKVLKIEDLIIYDSMDKDVTSRFDVNVKNNTVKAVAKKATLRANNFYGQDYRMAIKVSVRDSSDLIKRADGSNDLVVDNTAKITVDGKSKSTNTVKTTVKLPLTELGMEKIQIYTNRADEGLPVILEISQKNKYKMYANEEFDVELYQVNDSSKQLVAKKTMKLEELQETTEMAVSENHLQQDTVKSYEAIITNYNNNHLNVKDSAKSIDTLGYTASEEVIEHTLEEGKKLEYEGVIMTEREIGKDMEEFKERLTVPYFEVDPIKTGYGADISPKLVYHNDLSTPTPIDAKLLVDNKLIDSYLEYEEEGGFAIIPFSENHVLSEDNKKITQNYKLPEVYVEKKTGNLFSKEQKESNDDRIVEGLKVGGNKLYIPIWLDSLGDYDFYFQSKQAVGVNEVDFNVEGKIPINAYMFGYIGSETIDEDEILLVPVDPKHSDVEDLPSGWTEDDAEWLSPHDSN